MVATHVLIFCRIVLALVFMLSALGKLRDPAAFRESIADFKLLPAQVSGAAAWSFLAGEIAVVALLLVGGVLLPFGFGLAIILLAIFTAALSLVLRRKLQVVCNCFGRAEQHVSAYDVLRNLLLIGCGLLGLIVMPGANLSISGAELILIALIASVFTVCMLNLADISETLRQPFRIN